MLTVREFKDLGVEFVNGDRLGGDYIGNWSDADDIHFKFDPNAYFDFMLNSFAWRTNTGVNPSFDGLIEYIVKGGDCFVRQCQSVVFDYTGYGDGFQVIKWRPLLDQSQTETKEESEAFDKMKAHEFDAHVSSEKPVFTQAMADKGEKVKPDMLFSTATGEYVALMVSDKQVVFWHESLGFVVESHAFIHPIDTRTPKQKAVDEMLQIIDDQCSYRKACEIIYNMLVDEKC